MVRMAKKPLPIVELTLDRIIGGGQTIGTLENGKKCLVWGGLPGERVLVKLTKKKSSYVEGFTTEVLASSKDRITPLDLESYLSTSPWQIMTPESELHYKAALIEEAFELHDIVLPAPITVWTDGKQYGYRNKVEYSFWYDTENEKLDLAFFRRGTHGKIAVDHTSLAKNTITEVSKVIRDALNKLKIDGRALKTVIIRCNQQGNIAWQLYVKDREVDTTSIINIINHPSIINGEVIYSNPQSPASVITERLASKGDKTLTDTLMGVPFSYATEGFFQINLPVYEQALHDMKEWIDPSRPVVDLYSGVGTIGLTIGGDNVTLVEINEHAVREMERNIGELGRVAETRAVLAASENALEYIDKDATIILDPPRAGLHEKVIQKLIEVRPERIIYLSCNPVTQARDIALLAEKYGIRHHKGYNFFPRTPHIENLAILDALQ